MGTAVVFAASRCTLSQGTRREWASESTMTAPTTSLLHGATLLSVFGRTVGVMDEKSVSELLSALVRQGEEQTEMLHSIDNRLAEVIQGVATVADVSMD